MIVIGLSRPFAPLDRGSDDTPPVGRDHAYDRDPVSHPEPRVLVLRHAREIDADAGAGVRLNDHLLTADPLHEAIDTNDLVLRGDGRRQTAAAPSARATTAIATEIFVIIVTTLHDCDARKGLAGFRLSNSPDPAAVETPSRVVAASARLL